MQIFLNFYSVKIVTTSKDHTFTLKYDLNVEYSCEEIDTYK